MIYKKIAADALVRGLDLAHPFQVQSYNEIVDPPHQLPYYNQKNTLGIIIGNSKYLWPFFIKELKQNKTLLSHPHPLDHYVQQSVLSFLDEIEISWQVFWAELNAPKKIALQRLAKVSGLADLSPSHLNVHQEFGPWIAFRAVIVFDVDRGDVKTPVINLCEPCAKPCLEPFKTALKKDLWENWLKVRTSCPVGKKYQYSEGQTKYHYTKDKTILNVVAMSDTGYD